MLDSLGRQAVGFAPESELDVGGGVLAGLGGGSFVGGSIGVARFGGFAAVAQHDTTEQDCVDHEFLTSASEGDSDADTLAMRSLGRRLRAGLAVERIGHR